MARIFNDEVSFLQRKIPVLAGCVGLFIVIVLLRLFYLQIYHGTDYRNLSEQISVRDEEVPAKRGLILDRFGKVLADSRTYFEITVIPQYLRDRKKTIDSLSKLIPVPAEEIEDKIQKARFSPPFQPVVLVADAPYDWVAKIRERERPEYDDASPYYLEGVQVRSSPMRLYLYPELFSHVLGYLKEIDQPTLDKFEKANPGRYSSGDWIGAAGLENHYDLDLRGHDGVKTRVVDARGREAVNDETLDILKERTSYAPEGGSHLMTTLDYDAQSAAAKALEGKRGSVVAMEPETGEVLVLYSSPAYDPNRITGKIDKPYWQMINLHEDKYLYNRAVQATYPPGSIYKIVPAFAALDSNAVTPETSYYCGGGMQFGSRYFKCWNKSGHGTVNLLRGIAQSCDVYFYQVGLKIGVDTLHDYANLMGFGAKTGIDIPFEQAGLIPSNAWKMRRHKTPWIESETLSVVIGQGYDLVTPLQSARMISMVANGGRPLKPHLAKKIIDPADRSEKQVQFPLGEPRINLDYLHQIQEGLITVVQGQGTATRLKASPYKIAGKTGTAQVIGHDSKIAVTARTQAHGWFVAYAPYEEPKIAVAVIVENGGSGSGAAAPVAQLVIDVYLDKVIGREPKNAAAPGETAGGSAQ